MVLRHAVDVKVAESCGGGSKGELLGNASGQCERQSGYSAQERLERTSKSRPGVLHSKPFLQE
jgi:hypothetical protein